MQSSTAFPSKHPSLEEEDEAEMAVAPVEELAAVDLGEELLGEDLLGEDLLESLGIGTT